LSGVASIDSVSVTALLSVALGNGVLLGGVREILPREEQGEALRLDRALLQGSSLKAGWSP
jgi:hypothetical protein